MWESPACGVWCVVVVVDVVVVACGGGGGDDGVFVFVDAGPAERTPTHQTAPGR